MWSYAIGSDRAQVTLRADWCERMRRVRKELGIGYVRFHGFLDDGLATLLDEQGTLRYACTTWI